MTRIHKLSAAAFLLAAALPALADPPRILNVGVSNRQVLGACPAPAPPKAVKH